MALSYQLVFAKDERVLCFHHDLLWEAKILDSKLSVPEYTSVRHYLVHYKGWKNTYVELVFSHLLVDASPYSIRDLVVNSRVTTHIFVLNLSLSWFNTRSPTKFEMFQSTRADVL